LRTPTNSSIQYTPGVPPSDPKEISRYLQEEFIKLSAAVDALAAGHLEVTFVAPTKPRKGNFRIADGTSWNPGSGFGYYAHNGTAWVLIKAL